MSRIGKNPVALVGETKASLVDRVLSVNGKLGVLTLKIPNAVEVVLSENILTVSPAVESKQARMLWGTVRAHIANMIHGVSYGFTKTLHLNGVGYRATLKENLLVLNLGYSHEVRYAIPPGVQVMCPKPTEIIVHGLDKQLVGLVASKVRRFRPPEPYKGKGIKYINEVIFRKEGKKK